MILVLSRVLNFITINGSRLTSTCTSNITHIKHTHIKHNPTINNPYLKNIFVKNQLKHIKIYFDLQTRHIETSQKHDTQKNNNNVTNFCYIFL